MLQGYNKVVKQKKIQVAFEDEVPGQEFHTALIKVAKGIEKNTPQNPNKVPNKNTARIIIKGCSLTASEKIIGTNKFPSIN